MSRFRDYDASIFQESKKHKKAEDEVKELKGKNPKRDVEVDVEKECGDGCSTSKKIDFGTESTKPKKKKNQDVVDVEECGDGCAKPIKEAATTEPGDVDVETGGDEGTDMDTSGGDTDFSSESAKPKKKKQDTDLDIDDEEDDEDECEDGECNDEDDDECDDGDVECDDEPKKKSKKKKSSKKKDVDTDIDLDDEDDDEKDGDDEEDEEDDFEDLKGRDIDFSKESWADIKDTAKGWGSKALDATKSTAKKAAEKGRNFYDTKIMQNKDTSAQQSAARSRIKQLQDDIDTRIDGKGKSYARNSNLASRYFDDPNFVKAIDSMDPVEARDFYRLQNKAYEKERSKIEKEIGDRENDIRLMNRKNTAREALQAHGQNAKKKIQESKDSMNKNKIKSDMVNIERDALDIARRTPHGGTLNKIAENIGDEVMDMRKAFKEYTVESYIDQIEEDQLQMEREIMTSMMEDLYKEYLMTDYVEDLFVESEEEVVEDNQEVVQERFFGGAGKQGADLVKPVAKGARKLVDIKHGVPRRGIIRNVIHRTNKDLKKGGMLYKLVAWPFLVIKNLVQTLYHKTKSFVMYKGLLIGIEVKINREIAKIRKRARNLPKMAMAGGIGYATAAVAATAKGEPLPLKPLDFITSEGAKLVEELGRDTMIRALTSKLADAIEESPEKVREVISKNKEKMDHVTPEMGRDAKPVITMNQNKITVEGLVNMRGIDVMMKDIDRWAEITEGVVLGVRSGDESCVQNYLNKMKDIESNYIGDNGSLKMDMIFNAKSGAVKLADFYEELASKLTEKAKKLDKGLEKITGLENAVKEGNVSVASDTERALAELNNSIQHTCNAFLEMIDSIDDLGKYVMNTMTTYLGCLEQTAANMTGNAKGRNDDSVSEDDNGTQEFKTKKKHKLFGKKELEEE